MTSWTSQLAEYTPTRTAHPCVPLTSNNTQTKHTTTNHQHSRGGENFGSAAYRQHTAKSKPPRQTGPPQTKPTAHQRHQLPTNKINKTTRKKRNQNFSTYVQPTNTTSNQTTKSTKQQGRREKKNFSTYAQPNKTLPTPPATK